MRLKLDTGDFRTYLDFDQHITELLSRFPATGTIEVTHELPRCMCCEGHAVCTHTPGDTPLQIVNSVQVTDDSSTHMAHKFARYFAARVAAGHPLPLDKPLPSS